jgi:DMSO/TMAO reductase YedYZ molybdopterin-dependent catalytic subunit
MSENGGKPGETGANLGLPAGSDKRGDAPEAAAAPSPGLPSEVVEAGPARAAVTGTAPPPTDHATAEESISRQNAEVLRRMRQQTRRSFLVAGAAALAGFGGFRWLTSRRLDDGTPWPFRQALRLNEQLARDYFRPDRLAPAFSPAAAGDRVNGDIGLDDEIDVDSWQLQVEGIAGRDEPLMLSLDAIKKLPRVEMTTEFKCIEGWSKVMQWAGVRFSDFMAAHPPVAPDEEAGDQSTAPPYVAMATPDLAYYVGVEMESMLHPQTLLAYEMNGAPLTQDHGAPLRLVTTVKYGVKNLKRIGTIRYSRARPADYWTQRGYDWYIGL